MRSCEQARQCLCRHRVTVERILDARPAGGRRAQIFVEGHDMSWVLTALTEGGERAQAGAGEPKQGGPISAAAGTPPWLAVTRERRDQRPSRVRGTRRTQLAPSRGRPANSGHGQGPDARGPDRFVQHNAGSRRIERFHDGRAVRAAGRLPEQSPAGPAPSICSSAM